MTSISRAVARAHPFALLVSLALAVGPQIAAAQTSAVPKQNRKRGTTQKQPASAHIVVIKAMQFQPGELTVSAGETVTWENQDIVPHTVTSEKGDYQSPLIDPGKSWSYTATKPGRSSYTCIPHPNMYGTLVVQ